MAAPLPDFLTASIKLSRFNAEEQIFAPLTPELHHMYVIPMVLNNYIHVSEVDKGFEGIRVNIPDERPIPDVSEESVDEVVSALNSTASKRVFNTHSDIHSNQEGLHKS